MKDELVEKKIAEAEAFVRRALSHFPTNEKVSDAAIRSAALKVLKAFPAALKPK